MERMWWERTLRFRYDDDDYCLLELCYLLSVLAGGKGSLVFYSLGHAWRRLWSVEW